MSYYPRDIINFQLHYPDQGGRDDKRLNRNLLFHRNEVKCIPDNLLIDELHHQWRGKYSILEREHGFIQWIFPIREHGVNFSAQSLQPHEILAMRADDEIMERLFTSYKLMLDFYGMRLEDEETGRLSRSTNYAKCYANLVRSPHNYLRITRILKCLSELGLEHLNAGFLLFVLSEQSEHGQLNTRTITSSMDNFWAGCIRDDQEREVIETLIEGVRYDALSFTTENYHAVLEARAKTGRLSWEPTGVDLAGNGDASSGHEVQGAEEATTDSSGKDDTQIDDRHE
ncbi:hypothetical protein FRB94_000306 [Tulasnella sp. JGI-2019a]|nr:hypothetical protein FRB93_003205 [Tulasnella sp. JGI-2019a]KAG9006895.1 hypothetical protein FRB94_000306 [Tulasnella sp. JGI-2019a]KAG9032210.1 hypothetical protein FRB95_001689 [Tulasnella sp. JGI-2019a]